MNVSDASSSKKSLLVDQKAGDEFISAFIGYCRFEISPDKQYPFGSSSRFKIPITYFNPLILSLSLCLDGKIKYKIRLILGLINYFMFDKFYFRLDHGTKFKFSPKIMGLAIPIKTWVWLGLN